MKLDLKEVTQQIELPDGSRIILCDRLGKKEFSNGEKARNVFLVGPDDQLIWQIRSKFDHEGNPFTNINKENEKFLAYRWDGGEYLIDLPSGFATPLQLIR